MNRFVVPREDRWMLCDETMAAFIAEPVTPLRLRRLQRESALGGHYADVQVVRERAYDLESRRLLRDIHEAEVA